MSAHRLKVAKLSDGIASRQFLDAQLGSPVEVWWELARLRRYCKGCLDGLSKKLADKHRSILARMSSADFVREKGLGLALLIWRYSRICEVEKGL